MANFDEYQKKAVISGTNHVGLCAPAGGGKTMCMAAKAVRLLKVDNLPPQKLLITTFTNDARDEISRRLKKNLGSALSSRLQIRTLHGACFLLLKKIITRFYPELPNYTLVEQGRAIYAIKKFITDRKTIHIKNCHEMLDGISHLKSMLITESDTIKYLTDNNIMSNVSAREVSIAYSHYESYLKNLDKIDFDDMSFKLYYLLKDNPKAQKYARNYFKYFLIDESHDLSYAQFEILKLICPDNATLIFDMKQSIYGFRCAAPKYLHDYLTKTHASNIDMMYNYRCSKKIIEVSNNLIKNNNKKYIGILPVPHTEEEGHVEVVVQENEEFEAQYILDEIEKLRNKGLNYNDIKILYRTHAQSRAIIDKLVIHKIPHEVKQGSFYARSEIKDIMTYLKLFTGHKTNLTDVKRIINKPLRYFKNEVITKAYSSYKKCKSSYTSFVQYLYCAEGEFSEWNAKKSLNCLYRDLQCGMNKKTSTEMIHYILNDLKYADWLMDNSSIVCESQESVDNYFGAIYALAERYSDPKSLIALVDGILDSMEKSKNKSEKDRIKLMTIHASKGLEAEAVFILSMVDSLMPHEKSDDIEEERRIAYVALTRAKKYLYLLTIKGKLYTRNVMPSFFIKEAGLKIPVHHNLKEIENGK